ncbi:hypothetical protein VZT92_024121 [Zoarces viviparus]|uniref:Uncharacterized protein n=1 Tax=Zoarces viviparus TaxID=48416 RepID=A0AAW1E3C5_ZOAVI
MRQKPLEVQQETPARFLELHFLLLPERNVNRSVCSLRHRTLVSRKEAGFLVRQRSRGGRGGRRRVASLNPSTVARQTGLDRCNAEDELHGFICRGMNQSEDRLRHVCHSITP